LWQAIEYATLTRSLPGLTLAGSLAKSNEVAGFTLHAFG
jgi:hypothetical protein